MNTHLSADEARHAAERIMQRCDELAALSEDEGQLTRVYLSPEQAQTSKLVGSWMAEAGMHVWQDSVGNICGRYDAHTSTPPKTPTLLLGSHLDTVRNAGRYDGMLGVITAIEVVACLHRQQARFTVPIEVIGFADEEGTRFGITMLGSRGLTGQWQDDWLTNEDRDGVTVANAMTTAGLDPKAIDAAKRPVEDILAYLELHIEQGPRLEDAGLALGVVTAINGARRLNCTFTGMAGHAGTVPMTQRKDALATAAHWMVQVEEIVKHTNPNLVATVGTLQCLPGAANVIAGEVRLSLDIRGPDDQILDACLAQLLAKASTLAEQRGCSFMSAEYYRIAATPCDPKWQQCLESVVKDVQGHSLSLPSGAGHDAIVMAERWPVGMLFMRCKGGISHHPGESVLTEDVAVALQAMLKAVVVYVS